MFLVLAKSYLDYLSMIYSGQLDVTHIDDLGPFIFLIPLPATAG